MVILGNGPFLVAAVGVASPELQLVSVHILAILNIKTKVAHRDGAVLAGVDPSVELVPWFARHSDDGRAVILGINTETSLASLVVSEYSGCTSVES